VYTYSLKRLDPPGESKVPEFGRFKSSDRIGVDETPLVYKLGEEVVLYSLVPSEFFFPLALSLGGVALAVWAIRLLRIRGRDRVLREKARRELLASQ
jgi:hypothetical protein